jgi:hypothetical protein
MAEDKGKPSRQRQPTPKRPRGGETGSYGSEAGSYGGDPPPDETEEAVGAHAAFVEAHFGGGAPADADLLDSAIGVWQRLPGAVVRGAALLRPNRPARQVQDPKR